jgi:transposase
VWEAMKRHEIGVLARAGVSTQRIAEATNVPARSVRRIVGEMADDEAWPMDDSQAPPPPRRPGRPSKVATYRPVIAELLAAQPALPTMEILFRVRDRGYDGGKSPLYDLVASMRSPAKPLLVRFEGLPGEFSQNDFGEVIVRYASGEREKLHFFAARLKYSRWVYVRIVPDQKVESLVRALLLSFESFGGVPLVGVFDNPKTVVIRRVGDRIEWNRTFGQAALDYRFGPELCTPARGQEKGAVENLVGFVKGSFFKVRRFLDREDLLQQLDAWMREVNETRKCRATNQTPLARIAVERERLRALPIPPRDYALRFASMVGPTAMVDFEGHRYAMPPESIGFPATLYVTEDTVRIEARKYQALHDRHPTASGSSYLPGQRAALLATVSGRRGRLYFKRQQILALGSSAEALLTEIVHLHPRTWSAEVEILFDLLERFGEQRMLRALETAVARRLFGAHFVQGLLQRGVA